MRLGTTELILILIIAIALFGHSFKREIDRRYPTIPDRAHTFIAGSSMGGLMSQIGRAHV